MPAATAWGGPGSPEARGLGPHRPPGAAQVGTAALSWGHNGPRPPAQVGTAMAAAAAHCSLPPSSLCDAEEALSAIVQAQEDGGANGQGTYVDALREISGGRKRSCWIWWVWPTVLALRRTTRPRYQLSGTAGVHSYIAHPVLRARLLEITEAACGHLEAGTSTKQLLGSKVDVEKFIESMTLFAVVAAEAHRAAADAADEQVPKNILATVAHLCCRALAATEGRSLCERTMGVLTSAQGGGLERWSEVLDPQQLLMRSGCAPTAESIPPPDRGSSGGGGGGRAQKSKRGAEQMSGLSVEEVEAKLAGLERLDLDDEDLDMVLPLEGFEMLAQPEPPAS